MKNLLIYPNRYITTWVEFSPYYGIATKSDIKKIDGYKYIKHSCDIHTGCYYKRFENRQKALQFIRNFDKKLSKRYICRLFTEKQFADRIFNDNMTIKFTQKQYNEVYFV